MYETSECVYVYFVIPRLVHKDVTKALVDLKRYVKVAFSPQRVATGILDAPKYFFVSNQLAKKWPHLFECSVVLAFHSIYPGVVASKWRQQVEDNSPSTGLRYIYGIVKRTFLFSTIGTTLQFIGAFPMRIQKAVLHTLQPLTIAIVFLCIYIFISKPILAVIPGVLVALLIAHRLRKKYSKRSIGEVTPVVDVSDSDDLDENGDELQSGDGDATRNDVIAQLSNMLKLHDLEEDSEEEEEDVINTYLDDRLFIAGNGDDSESYSDRRVAEIDELSSMDEVESTGRSRMMAGGTRESDDSDSTVSAAIRLPERLTPRSVS